MKGFAAGLRQREAEYVLVVVPGGLVGAGRPGDAQDDVSRREELSRDGIIRRCVLVVWGMGVTAIAKMSRPSGRGVGFLRCCLAGACLTVVIAAASPGTAGALVSRLGRWSGGGPGGEIQFAVSRVGGTLVLSNLVVSCSTGAAAAGYDDEEAIERNGRIYSYSFPADLSGRLGLGSGTVTASGSVAQLSGCGDAGLRDVRVAPSGARVVRDGTYSITGLLGTYGTATVHGDGALLEYTASFATPVGAVEDNPEGCAEEAVAATSSANPVLPAADGSFSAHTITALGFVAEASLSGRFTSATSAVGTYSATFVDGDVVDCAGDGRFALALVHAAPALEPVRAPKPGPPGPTPPAVRIGVRCASRSSREVAPRTRGQYFRPTQSPWRRHLPASTRWSRRLRTVCAKRRNRPSRTLGSG